MYRTTGEPEYWKDEQGKVKTRYYKLSEVKKQPEKVFLDFSSFYINRGEREKRAKSEKEKLIKSQKTIEIDIEREKNIIIDAQSNEKRLNEKKRK